MEPNFVKGAKYEKWNPLFETLATFAFTPKLVTTKGAHIRDGVDLKRTMMMVIIALIPCLLFWNLQYRSLANGCRIRK